MSVPTDPDQLREVVRERYATAARGSGETGCCAPDHDCFGSSQSPSPATRTATRPLGRDLHWWCRATGFDTAPLGRWLSALPDPVVDDGLIDFQRSFSSATVRGVARDARHVLARLAAAA